HQQLHFFFSYYPAITDFYTLSLHDALPISHAQDEAGVCGPGTAVAGARSPTAGDRPPPGHAPLPKVRRSGVSASLVCRAWFGGGEPGDVSRSVSSVVIGDVDAGLPRQLGAPRSPRS